MELLEETKRVLQKYPCNYKKSYDKFNIIEILGLENKEVYIKK